MVNAIEILVSSNHGVFIPQIFINDFNLSKFNIVLSDYDKKVLQDASHEWYWEIWQTIENNALYIDSDKNEYTLMLDGDLFMICYELMTDEDKENFGFDL